MQVILAVVFENDQLFGGNVISSLWLEEVVYNSGLDYHKDGT